MNQVVVTYWNEKWDDQDYEDSWQRLKNKKYRVTSWNKNSLAAWPDVSGQPRKYMFIKAAMFRESRLTVEVKRSPFNLYHVQLLYATRGKEQQG